MTSTITLSLNSHRFTWMTLAVLAYSRYGLWITGGSITDKEGLECGGLGVEHDQAII
jgi:hypothetical protein